MKKISKYLLLLVAAVFTFTACEKNVEREPSPFAPLNAFAFASSSAVLELDPEMNPPYEQAITVLRTTNIDKLDTLHLVIVADTVFHIDTALIFKAGEKAVTTTIKFPYASDKETYTAKLSIPEDQRNPYANGYADFQMKLSFVTWSELREGVFVDDAVIASTFGVPAALAWKVNYQVAQLPDGNIRARIINPFACMATEDPDEYGIYNGYPYNEEGDFDTSKDYNIVLLIDPKTKKIGFTAQKFDLGVDWNNYGMMHLYDYKGVVGTYVPGTSFTFLASDKTMVFGMGDGDHDLQAYAGFRFYLTVQAYVDQLPQGPDPVDADVATYEGHWAINGLDPKDGTTPVSANVTVTSYEDPTQGQFYAIEGLFADMPVVYGTFDEKTHMFKIEASQGDPVDIGGTSYVPVLYMLDADLNTSGSITLDIAPGEGGTLVTDESSAAVGFVIVYINPKDQSDYKFGDGMVDISFEPLNAGAPAHKAAKKHVKRSVKTLRHTMELVR